MQDLADAPISEICHDRCNKFHRDDDLILHSALNTSTSTVSQFFYHYTLRDLADAPILEICHDRCNEFQRDDDLILHSALNISTSTFSQFFYHYICEI
jgi:hypothetical protein